MKKLSIIIPAYNEERSISQILGKIHQTRLIGETEKEILIIDDGSKDSTAEKCRQFMQAHPDLDIHYHLQPFNQSSVENRHSISDRRLDHHSGCRPGI